MPRLTAGRRRADVHRIGRLTRRSRPAPPRPHAAREKNCSMTTRRPVLALVSLLTVGLVAAGCTDGGTTAPEPGPQEPTVKAEPDTITFGAFGTEEEMVAWDAVLRDFNQGNDATRASLVEWTSREAAREALAKGDPDQVPDVFLLSRQDLRMVMEEELNRPVSELLDERGVDFGDKFSRDAVESFSFDGDLQCMAYSISPTVMYLNEQLIDFDVMKQRGMAVSNRWDRWWMQDFAAAAKFGTKPRRGVAGVHIEPTVEGLAPFIHSGGGKVFDDERNPTTLAFSSDETREALEQALPVLRDASLTLSEQRLEKRDALEWFTRGKVAMIAGERGLVPELRGHKDLAFNVMPMPYLGNAATTGDVNGLCLSAATRTPGQAADLIAHLVSDEATAEVTRAGATVPANLTVAASEDFLQPEQRPERARVFNSVVRGIAFPPLLESWEELESAVAPHVRRLLLEPGEIDLEEITELIDEASRSVLDPEYVDPESEGEGEGEGDREAPSEDASETP
ncbi:extracellular solute-binding protein [Nocardioides sp. Y6]|uniref:Extracellular solute-binding protein n=1 Tax=Nocardioides malaquae TaxID=2773426 RepID=A0ABR9RTH6_9ACTN|nr:extracellular solute-binding protein [Nocardioides malaquae]MBE7324680.1 extracellular solute-binding protein [Nocardioides malaquae]